MDSVSKVLNRGGLYLLDEVVRFNIVAKLAEHWTMKRNGIRLPAAYQPKLVDPLEQTCVEHVILDVDTTQDTYA